MRELHSHAQMLTGESRLREFMSLINGIDAHASKDRGTCAEPVAADHLLRR